MRRAVRALGHAPLVFDNLEELMLMRGTRARCSLMCLGLPPDHIDLHTWVQKARSVVGASVPVLFVTRENLLKALQSLGSVEGDSLLVAPSSFAEVYNALCTFMAQHGVHTIGSGLSWDQYVFIPSQVSVMIDGTEISLGPVEFELALEFFHNVDRVLSRDWLRAMTSGMFPDAPSRWIDANVARLRSNLGLASFKAGEWRLHNVRYAGYKLSKDHGKKQPKTLSVMQDQLQHQSEPSP